MILTCQIEYKRRRGKIRRYLANISKWFLEQGLAGITKRQNLLTATKYRKMWRTRIKNSFSSRQCHFDFSTKSLQSGVKLLKSKEYWTLTASRQPMVINRFFVLQRWFQHENHVEEIAEKNHITKNGSSLQELILLYEIFLCYQPTRPYRFTYDDKETLVINT